MIVRIAIADGHATFVQHIKEAFGKHAHLVVEDVYRNLTELLIGIDRATPDILLMDITLPGLFDEKLLEAILRKYTGLRVLLMGETITKYNLQKIVSSGGKGYIEKKQVPERFISAIDTIHNGEIFIESLAVN